MKHSEVINNRKGKRVKEQGFKTYECVAWAKKYCTERWWQPLSRFGGVWAYQGWINNNKTFWSDYDRIENKAELHPVAGDVIIFKPTDRNYHGHIAIVDNADLKLVSVWEQNWAQGDWDGLGGDEIRLANYTYANVAGRYHNKHNPNIVEIPKPVSPYSTEDFKLVKKLIDDWIWNGEQWDWMTNRIWLVIAKMYNKLKA